jgi:hypothetical protein
LDATVEGREPPDRLSDDREAQFLSDIEMETARQKPKESPDWTPDGSSAWYVTVLFPSRTVLLGMLPPRHAMSHSAHTRPTLLRVLVLTRLRASVRVAPPKQNSCEECFVKFNVFRRRHHCRRCGRLVCDKCAPKDNTKPILEFGVLESVRHCLKCYVTPKLRDRASTMTQ